MSHVRQLQREWVFNISSAFVNDLCAACCRGVGYAPVIFAMHPLDALKGFAKSRHPDRELPSDVYLLHDSQTVTVFDKFPKGMFSGAPYLLSFSGL